MNAEVIQAQYDELESIATRFGQCAESNAEMSSHLRQCAEKLIRGDWIGKGAEAFSVEMNSEVFPALQRLTKALTEARSVTLEVKEIVKQAEEEAASPFRGGHPSGALPAFLGSLNTVFAWPWGGLGGGAASPNLGVSDKQITSYDWAFRGKRGEEFKQTIEWAAKEVGINPGLLAANVIAETSRDDYLVKGKVDSFLIGTDDFYDKRNDISNKVPAYSKIGWDKTQTPVIDTNENGRQVKTIYFNSGKDALLASAVYLKHDEEVLRQEAAKNGKDFDKLPVETRFALTRLAFNAGLGRAKKNLLEALDGQDILVHTSKKKEGPQRKATIHTAQAMHLSETIFGVTPD
jgi:WXG100 family type VII secretion target